MILMILQGKMTDLRSHGRDKSALTVEGQGIQPPWTVARATSQS